MDAAARRLAWEGCGNARHLGGLATADGAVTRVDGLARSGSLASLTAAGIEAVLADGVTTVVDLRFAQEVAADPGRLAAVPGVAYRHRPLMTTDAAAAIAAVRAATTTRAAYAATLAGFGANVAAVVEAIATASPGRVVVHCSAGRDRTGLVVALVLRAVGVGTTAVADDYAAVGPDAADGDAPEGQVIVDVLEAIEGEHGTVAAFLATCGVDAALLAALRARIVEDRVAPTGP